MNSFAHKYSDSGARFGTDIENGSAQLSQPASTVTGYRLDDRGSTTGKGRSSSLVVVCKLALKPNQHRNGWYH